MEKAVFLDRDGTINIDKKYLFRIEDFEFTYRALDALAIFGNCGYKIVIITNQSGIARGFYTENDVIILHAWLKQLLYSKGIDIAGIYYCPHHPDGVIEKYSIECNCRKPSTGLYYRAIRDLNIDMSVSYAIGDNLRDLEICRHTDVKGILISEKCTSDNGMNNENNMYLKTVKNLFEAALYIKGQDG